MGHGRAPWRRDGRAVPNERANAIEGEWPRAVLKRTDAQFVERVERAISKGREQRLRQDRRAASGRLFTSPHPRNETTEGEHETRKTSADDRARDGRDTTSTKCIC